MRMIFAFLTLLVTLTLASTDARAQRGVLVWENDAIADTDRDYTQGFRASLVFDDFKKHLLAAQAFDFLKIGLMTAGAPAGPVRQQLEWVFVGQSIFTPPNSSNPLRAPGDRPFGGWLYTGVNVAQETAGRQLDSFEILAGVVGPAALANEVQGGFHDLLGQRRPTPGNYQIRNEPALLLAWDRRWKFGAEIGNGFGVDFIPSVGVTAGNVYTYGSVGGMVRFGRLLSSTWGPTRVRPSPSGASFFSPATEGPWWGFALFAGVEGRAVAHNVFLDGNLLTTSPSVKKNVLVGDAVAGLEIFNRVGSRIAVSATYRSKEYTTQVSPHIFGSLEASVKF